MSVKFHWSTPIMEVIDPLPDHVRGSLISVLVKKEEKHKELLAQHPNFQEFMKTKKFYASSHYNLFDEADQTPEGEAIRMFEKYACGMFRRYLRESFDIKDADEVKIAGRCFGNTQTKGARTYPHYHQGVDGVLVHYLTLGHGTDEEVNLSHRHGGHALLLMDPRPVPSYPYWEKVLSIQPQLGMTIVHPGYLWHETNPFRHDGHRVAIVVNFQVISNTYAELHKPLRY